MLNSWKHTVVNIFCELTTPWPFTPVKLDKAFISSHYLKYVFPTKLLIYFQHTVFMTMLRNVFNIDDCLSYILEIKTWTGKNLLKLNRDKTNILILGSDTERVSEYLFI